MYIIGLEFSFKSKLDIFIHELPFATCPPLEEIRSSESRQGHCFTYCTPVKLKTFFFLFFLHPNLKQICNKTKTVKKLFYQKNKFNL